MEGRISIDEAESIAYAACLRKLPYKDKYYSYYCDACELQFVHNQWIYAVNLSIFRKGGLFNSIQSAHSGKVQIDAEEGTVIGIRMKDK